MSWIICSARVLLGAALIALGSCATLNEDQCREVNWEQLGYDDGQAGRNASHVDLHRQALPALRHHP